MALVPHILLDRITLDIVPYHSLSLVQPKPHTPCADGTPGLGRPQSRHMHATLGRECLGLLIGLHRRRDT